MQESYQPIGILVSQRAKQHGVDDTENCRVGAYAESEGEDGDTGEAGIFREHARAETDVLEQRFEEREAHAARDRAPSLVLRHRIRVRGVARLVRFMPRRMFSSVSASR